MTWNHRIIRHDDGRLAIHEVYYDQYGAPDMVTEDPVPCVGYPEDGDALGDLRRTIARFLLATGKPILDMRQFEAAEESRGDA